MPYVSRGGHAINLRPPAPSPQDIWVVEYLSDSVVSLFKKVYLFDLLLLLPSPESLTLESPVRQAHAHPRAFALAVVSFMATS